VRVQQGVDEQALLVPMQAIQRTPDGLNTLMVVRDGVVNPVAVAVGPEVNGRALVYKGLSPGDVVVVEGFQKIRPGAPVQPMPWNPEARPGAGGPGAGATPEAQQKPAPAAGNGTASPAPDAGQGGTAAGQG